MDNTPTKSTGMPIPAKILMLTLIVGLGLFFVYNWINRPINETSESPTYPKPETQIAHAKGEVMFARCNDGNTLSIYLETDITYENVKAIYLAVIQTPTHEFLLTGYQYQIYSDDKILVLYDGCYSQDVLMCKLKEN